MYMVNLCKYATQVPFPLSIWLFAPSSKHRVAQLENTQQDDPIKQTTQQAVPTHLLEEVIRQLTRFE